MTEQDMKQALQQIANCKSIAELQHLSMKYMSLSHPSIQLYLAYAFQHKYRRTDLAKAHYILGAKCGLNNKNRFWNDMNIDSVGQCISLIVVEHTKDKNMTEMTESFVKLGYIYLSRSIELFSAKAPDSYNTRAILFYNYHSLIIPPFTTIIPQVNMLSDYYYASIAYANINERLSAEALRNKAIYNHKWLEDITVNGKDADEYSLTEIAIIGKTRSDALYNILLKDYLDGKLDITESSADLYFQQYVI